MNSGQTLLTLFALVLLMTLNVNMLRVSSAAGETVLKGKIGLAAISISTSMLEEAQRKNFDEIAAHDTAVNVLTLLTAPTSLGPESGETYATYDDFDDYNNYSTKFALQLPETLSVKCAVVYVDASTPNTSASTRTWHKKMTVSVTSPTLKDTVRTSFVSSYWYFR